MCKKVAFIAVNVMIFSLMLCAQDSNRGAIVKFDNNTRYAISCGATDISLSYDSKSLWCVTSDNRIIVCETGPGIFKEIKSCPMTVKNGRFLKVAALDQDNGFVIIRVGNKHQIWKSDGNSLISSIYEGEFDECKFFAVIRESVDKLNGIRIVLLHGTRIFEGFENLDNKFIFCDYRKLTCDVRISPKTGKVSECITTRGVEAAFLQVIDGRPYVRIFYTTYVDRKLYRGLLQPKGKFCDPKEASFTVLPPLLTAFLYTTEQNKVFYSQDFESYNLLYTFPETLCIRSIATDTRSQNIFFAAVTPAFISLISYLDSYVNGKALPKNKYKSGSTVYVGYSHANLNIPSGIDIDSFYVPRYRIDFYVTQGRNATESFLNVLVTPLVNSNANLIGYGNGRVGLPSRPRLISGKIVFDGAFKGYWDRYVDQYVHDDITVELSDFRANSDGSYSCVKNLATACRTLTEYTSLKSLALYELWGTDNLGLVDTGAPMSTIPNEELIEKIKKYPGFVPLPPRVRVFNKVKSKEDSKEDLVVYMGFNQYNLGLPTDSPININIPRCKLRILQSYDTSLGCDPLSAAATMLISVLLKDFSNSFSFYGYVIVVIEPCTYNGDIPLLTKSGKTIATIPDIGSIDSGEIKLTGLTHGNPNWWAEHPNEISIDVSKMSSNEGSRACIAHPFIPNYHIKQLIIDSVTINEKLSDGSVAELVQVDPPSQ